MKQWKKAEYPLVTNSILPSGPLRRALGGSPMTAERITFATARLTLRPPVLEDAQAVLRNYASDPEVTRYLLWRPHVDVAQTKQFIQSCLDRWDSGKELSWIITFHGSNEAIGMISCGPEGHKAVLGYALARSYWGQGIMTEAARCVTDWLRASPKIYRIWATCDVENRASARVMEKIGMECEGVLRRWMVFPNISPEPRDSLMYAWVR